MRYGFPNEYVGMELGKKREREREREENYDERK